MFKHTLLALVTLLVFLGSTALADKPKCKADKVPGSYVRLNPISTFMDQLRLNSDGTAYWYQSAAFHHLVSEGAFNPHIGSWKCLDDGSLLVTTIGSNYRPTVPAGDIELFQNERFTEKLTVVNNDTYQPTHRIFTSFLLLDDPLGSNGVATGCTPLNPCAPYAYKRVKPFPSDIP